MIEDIYDNGTPKYQSPMDIYEAVQNMATGEEIGILSDMFGDISWEGQDYYYTDAGAKLQERWEMLTDYGDKMWLMDVAAWQMIEDDVNDWMYQILCNEDLQKRIGWKKLFCDKVLGGTKSFYDKVSEEFEYLLQEMNRFGFAENSDALKNALESAGFTVLRNPYGDLCNAVYRKLSGLRLDEEKQLIVESRALLNAYDDFMFGLRSNQALYQQQETMYRQKVAQLKASYAAAVQKLVLAAEAQGVNLALPSEKALMIGEIQDAPH